MNALIQQTKRPLLVDGDPPMQQLCIVDSLWATKNVSTGGYVDSAPSRLTMGTLSSVVDYQTTKKVREQLMGASHPADPINRMLSDFGVSASQLEWLEVGGKPPTLARSRNSGAAVRLKVVSPRGGTASFALSEGVPYRVRITTADGRTVRMLSGRVSARTDHAVWDGRNNNGRQVVAGRYFVECIAGGVRHTKPFRYVF
jgi:hypothetical protein